MSCEQVIIYNGLSTVHIPMLQVLVQDAQRLKEHGVGYIRFGKSPLYGLPSHEFIPRQLRQEAKQDSYAKGIRADLFTRLNTEAKQYRTLLLTISCPWAEVQKTLLQRLRALPELQRARFRLLLHISPQEAVLEQRMRLAGNTQGAKFWKDEWLQSDVVRLSTMAEHLRKIYGRPNVAVCAGGNRPVLVQHDKATEQTLYEMFDVSPPSAKFLRRNRLDLLSREARHVLGLYAQLGNAWPAEASMPLLLSALSDAETTLMDEDCLDRRPMLSLQETLALRAQCEEENLNFVKAYPHASPLLAQRYSLPAENEPWEAYDNLFPAPALAMVKCLPDNVADGLRAALSVSERILTPSHQLLLSTLENTACHPPLRPQAAKDAKVAVLVQTYNQVNYVAQALESILEQKTDFDVEIIVVDDASTDGTQTVIDRFARKYGKIRPILLQTHSVDGLNTLALFRHARTPYVAICDGDDYFSDPCKLQIQADYLDQNPQCGLCAHPVRLVWEDGSPDVIYPDMSSTACGKKAHYCLEDLLSMNFIQTNSVMYRWRFGNGVPSWFDPMLVPGDWYWHLLHAEFGDIGFIDRVMSVYRRHSNSLFWRPQNSTSGRHRIKFGIRELRLYQKVEEHFGDKSRRVISRLINGVFADLLMHYKTTGNIEPLNNAIRYFPDYAKFFLQKVKNIDAA